MSTQTRSSQRARRAAGARPKRARKALDLRERLQIGIARSRTLSDEFKRWSFSPGWWKEE